MYVAGWGTVYMDPVLDSRDLKDSTDVPPSSGRPCVQRALPPVSPVPIAPAPGDPACRSLGCRGVSGVVWAGRGGVLKAASEWAWFNIRH